MWEIVLSAVDVHAAEIQRGRNWTRVVVELGSLTETLEEPMKGADEELKETNVDDTEAIF